MVYTAQLVVPLMLLYFLPSNKDYSLLVLVLLAYTGRVWYHIDKFILWGTLSAGLQVYRQGANLTSPVICICSCLLWYRQVNHKEEHVDPNSRVQSNYRTNATHTRLTIRTRNAIRNFMPGQFVTISDGDRNRKYTPLSVVSSADGVQSVLDLAVRRYMDEDTFSSYLYNRCTNDIVLVDGPFGTKFYDALDRRLEAGHQTMWLAPGKDTVVLVSGGSGLAPMYSLANSMLASDIRVVLVTADTSEDTAMLRVECNALEKRYPTLLKWHQHVTSAGTRLTDSDISCYVTSARVVCACGPQALMNFVCKSVADEAPPFIMW